MSSNQEEERNYISIPDDYTSYPVNKFCIPKHYDGALENIMIPNGLIQDRTERLARDIFEKIDHTRPIAAICVLKGGYQFFSDLLGFIQKLNASQNKSLQISLDFIRLKSYEQTDPGSAPTSTGVVKVIGGDDLSSIKGKNVLVVEDLIDTGRTMRKMLKVLEEYKPHSISVVTLMVKRTSRSSGYRPDFIGFEIPDEFIVGYACDYNEYFRDLKHIGLISEEGKRRFAVKKEE